MIRVIFFLFALLISGCSFNGVFFPIDNRPDDLINAQIESISLKSMDGLEIQHYLFKPAGAHKASIFVFQGSGSKVMNWYKVVKPLVEEGYQVFMMEYRGFGNSQGKASHKMVAVDAKNALDYLANRNDVKQNPLLVLGQSYGGQLAINVAYHRPDKIDALIVEGTFTTFSEEAAYSAPRIFSPLVKSIVLNTYKSKNLISEIDKPILIIHSREDKIAPFKMAEILYSKAEGEKELWAITGKHVAALLDMPSEYVAKIDGLLEQLHEKHQ